jgi:hypothetical protein
LDPARKPTLCLPPDDQLAVDLSSPRWKTVPGGKIVIESKDDLRKRIGRSPDKGDAVALAMWPSAGGVLTDSAESAFNWVERVTHETDDVAIPWDDIPFEDSAFSDSEMVP